MSPQKPTNIIYTGVAGTGKTYRLLQISQQYTDYLPRINDKDLLGQLLHELSWRDVVCLIFLDFKSKKQDLVKVPEVVSHEFFISKAAQNSRDKNLSNTAWSVLQMHTPARSQTVSYKNRASQAYFDKDNSGAWYLLPESMDLLSDLAQQLAEFQQAQRENNSQNQEFRQQRFSMISFHQAYGYEEFVEGIRPVMTVPNHVANSSTQMSYAIQDGAFLKLCQRAANDPDQRYAMLIDEINRANVSRVFGELLSLVETDKRAGMTNAMTVNLAYSGRTFSVPANVDIYATMNTQDHSLAPLDMALRRRFRFIDCPPQPELLPIIHINQDLEADNSEALHSKTANPTEVIDLAKILTGLNNRIAQTLGAEAQLGHAFLWSVDSLEQLQTALIEQIIPQLAQAAGGQVTILQYIFQDEQQPISAQFIQDSQALINNDANNSVNPNSPNQLFAGQQSFLGQSMSTGSYKINTDLLGNSAEFTKPFVYQRLY
ncbi:5-methylcytosine-specific restriction protein B [Psychrobacter luti]|uniref:5-methylcytosine-specific restriction protein B n=1 Tax=Psychrobacter luti TaxID=198481 RepID=A0A839TC25_9GAMM|nr:AAA family ATPase [Psychrobacter luti]MBB3106718.1 5-methylcytosine-specific restriction protein B [Psychrobacter luti]